MGQCAANLLPVAVLQYYSTTALPVVKGELDLPCVLAALCKFSTVLPLFYLLCLIPSVTEILLVD